ncbi:MAG: hypothetical protein AAFZ07_24630 [Actinomycetota bacterium]
MDPDELARRARDLVVDDAAAQRSRRSARRAAADELASLAALVLAAARRRREVGLTLLGGQQLRLVPSLVGADVVAGARPGAPTEIVALAAVAAIDLDPDLGPDPDADPTEPSLHDVLTSIVDERPPVAVWTRDGLGPHAGDLAAVGLDAVVIAPGNGSRRAIPLSAIARLRLAP